MTKCSRNLKCLQAAVFECRIGINILVQNWNQYSSAELESIFLSLKNYLC